MHTKPDWRVPFVHNDYWFRLGDRGRYVAYGACWEMLYKVTQSATVVLLVSVAAILVVPGDYRLYSLAVAVICFLVIIGFTLLIFISPKNWRK